MFPLCSGLAAALTLVVGGSAVSAQDEGEEPERKRVAVEPMRGPFASTFQQSVERALGRRPGISVLDGDDTRDAAARYHVRLERSNDYVEIASDMNIAAFVSGTVERRGRALRVRLRVRQGVDGELVTETTFFGNRPRNITRAIGRQLWSRIGGAIDRAPAPQSSDARAIRESNEEAPPPVDRSGPSSEEVIEESRRENLDEELFPEGGDDDDDDEDSDGDDDEEDEEEEEEEEEEDTGSFRQRHLALFAEAGLRVVNRSLSLSEDNADDASNHSLPFAFAPLVSVDWFPLAHFMNGPLAHIGAFVDFSTTLFASTEGGGNSFPTQELEWLVGGGYRLELGTLALIPRLSFGSHTFDITSDGMGPSPPISGMGYDLVRVGAGLGLPIGTVDLALDVGVRVPLGFHGLGDRIADTSAFGFDATLGGVVPVIRLLSVRVAADFKMYLVDFTPAPMDALEVGGATDLYLGVHVTAALRLGPEQRPD